MYLEFIPSSSRSQKRHLDPLRKHHRLWRDSDRQTLNPMYYPLCHRAHLVFVFEIQFFLVVHIWVIYVYHSLFFSPSSNFSCVSRSHSQIHAFLVFIPPHTHTPHHHHQLPIALLLGVKITPPTLACHLVLSSFRYCLSKCMVEIFWWQESVTAFIFAEL